MTFDLFDVPPPFWEVSAALQWAVLLGCLLGSVSCAITGLMKRASPRDYIVWSRALLSGAVVGLGLLWLLARQSDPNYYAVLFFDWVLFSGFGSGVFLWISKVHERRNLGRLIVQALALFGLGIPMPALLAAVLVRFVFS